MGGKASAASKNKWNEKTYDRVNLILRKDAPQNKAAVQAAADAAGESLNAYIVGAVAQRMDRDASAPDQPTERPAEPPGALTPEDEDRLR
jgi:hypothetical protein